MIVKNLTAGQHACSVRDDRSIEKDDKRHVGDGIVAENPEELMLYLTCFRLTFIAISFVL
jgi:hypothetical protein